MPSRALRRILPVVAVGVAASVALAGCTGGNDSSLSTSYSRSVTKGYTAGDGSLVTLPPSKRKATPSWSTTDFDGASVSRDSLRGKVVVLNFWYAGCPPCREEAPDLRTLYRALDPKGVVFLGVNTRDSKVTAKEFAARDELGYPSVLDVDDAVVQQAFAGNVPSTPVTLVLDRQGRVAARFSGPITSATTAEDVVHDVLAEKS